MIHTLSLSGDPKVREPVRNNKHGARKDVSRRM